MNRLGIYDYTEKLGYAQKTGLHINIRKNPAYCELNYLLKQFMTCDKGFAQNI